MRYTACLLALLLASPVYAVRTSHWKQTSEADFKAGTFHNVVATNFGEVKLSRAVRTLLEQDARVSAVYSLAEAPDGTLYAGTGPQGVLLSFKDGQTQTAAKLEDGASLLSLLVDAQGRLLIGTGGDKGRVLRLDKPGDKLVEIFAAEGVQYIWAMTQTPDGNLYLATGPTGQLFEVKPDGSHTVLLDSTEKNLLSMVSDGKDLLYVGTDPDGLVYRVNRKNKELFVLYDAPESEIGTLVLDARGNLYAGTSEMREGMMAGKEEESEAGGRPESTGGEVSIPSQAPKAPAPPPLPNPNPGEPPPIPKHEPKPQGLLPLPPGAEGQFLIAPETQPAAQRRPGPPAPATPASAPGQEGPAINAPAEEGEAESPPPPRAEGNAIYRIDPDGFVTEVFRRPVLVFSMIEQDGTLLVGTGNEGVVYQVNPAAEETTELAKVDPKQVMCLKAGKDGQVYLGLANVGGVAVMSGGFAGNGTFTSPVLDASQVSRFGRMQIHGWLPDGATLTLATRSGNVAEAGESGWSKWSPEIPATEFIAVPSPSARYLQYRFTFASSDGKVTAILDDVDVAYQVPNLAPKIKAIKLPIPAVAAAAGDAADAEPPAEPAPKAPRTRLNLTWETEDPNLDPLVYALHLRAGSTGPWILLKDDLRQPQFAWDTRTVPDGRYYIRVTASDALANAPGQGKTASRVSDPILVDNTPPVIGDLTWQKGPQVKLQFKVVDRTSTVASVEYAVDSHTDWQLVLPSDNIYDGPEESVAFTLTGLRPGVHQVTLRATDSHGNQAYENVQVTVEPPTSQPAGK